MEWIQMALEEDQAAHVKEFACIRVGCHFDLLNGPTLRQLLRCAGDVHKHTNTHKNRLKGRRDLAEPFILSRRSKGGRPIDCC